MSDDTLILRLRAETLRANLTRLKDLATTPDRKVDLDSLSGMVDTVRSSIVTADRARADLWNKIDEGKPIRWNEQLEAQAAAGSPGARTVANIFDAMRQNMDQARRDLASLRVAIEEMKIKCFTMAGTPVGQDIKDDLKRTTGPLIAGIENIQLQRNNSNDLATAWITLNQGTADTEPIFTDYMELLGGAALRDAGFDEKISYFADELLRFTGGKLLALPTRRKALVTTFKQIIRVTFPDWTVWALPLAALEFWNVVGSQKMKNTIDAKLRNSANGQQLIEAREKECLGHAYATYTMGPAYAYCAVGLLLAPDSEQDHYRVRAILYMLEKMEKAKSPADTRYTDVRRQLLTAWNAARTQLNQPTLNLNIDDPGKADVTDPEGKTLRMLIRNFWEVLELETSAIFSAGIWKEIQPWVPLLLDGKVEEIKLPNGVELRHVLNAAWLARVRSDNTLQSLSEAVKKLQDRVKTYQEEGR